MQLSSKLFGALTSKPYAFKARSWELRSIETIDLFDSLCSNIKLDVRNSEIMRILPVNNEVINEEWISDKSRYAFDSFKRDRFVNPMIKKNNIFVQVTWKEAFEYISTEITKRRLNNFVINTGNFTDIEHLVSLKELSKKISSVFNVSINNEKTNISDFQKDYTLKQNLFNFKGPKVFLLVGINLRLENPILNIKLKRLSLTNNVLIGYIGSKNNYNLNCEHLGNNLNTLTNIVAGKHKFCTVITNFLKKDEKKQKIDNCFKNHISVIFGNEISQLKNFSNIITTLKQVKTKSVKFDYSTLHLFTGNINMLEFGFFNKNYINKNTNTIFYLVDTETIANYKEGDFVIFQGNHNISARKYFDVILPTVNWTEKSNLYLNCFGYIQKTQFAILPPINSREDWKITVMLSNIFLNKTFEFKNNSSKYLENIHILVNTFSPNLMNFINKFKKTKTQEINLISMPSTKNVFNKNNMPFKSFIFNYYKITSLDKTSKIMNSCSIAFNQKKLNFFK
jgi:NADH-quinone oxidoreductase subunit G